MCAPGTPGSASPPSASASTSYAAGARPGTAPRRHRRRRVPRRRAVVRHLRPGRQGRRSAGRARRWAGSTSERVLAIGASQSAGRMTVYYQSILPKVEPVFDGYAFIVGIRADPGRRGAGVPGAVRDRRAEPGRPAAGHRRVPPLGGRRRRPLRLAGPGVPDSDLGARPRRRAGLRLRAAAVQPRPGQPGDRGGLRPPGAVGERRGAAAAAPYLVFNGTAPRRATSSGWRSAASGFRR